MANVGDMSSGYAGGFPFQNYQNPVRPASLPGPADIVNVPFEHVRIVELDYDVGEGLSYLAFLFAKSDAMQAGAQVLMSTMPDQGYSVVASFYTFGIHGVLTSDYYSHVFPYDKRCGLYIGGATDNTDLGPISDFELFKMPPARFIIVGDEVMGFGSATPIGVDGYHLTKVIRGMFNTPIQDHKMGDVVMGGLAAGCTYALSGTGTFYFKVVPLNRLGHVMDPSDVIPTKLVISDKSRAPLRPARLQAIRTGAGIAISWIPRVRGYGGAGNLSPEISIDLDPPYVIGHFAYSINDAPKRIQMEPYMDVSVAGEAVVRVWQRDSGMESDPITLTVPVADGTYFTN